MSTITASKSSALSCGGETASPANVVETARHLAPKLAARAAEIDQEATDAIKQVAIDAERTLGSGEDIAGAAAVVDGEVNRLGQTVSRFSGQMTG